MYNPKEQSPFTPHTLQRKAMLVMMGMVLLTFFASHLHALLWQSSEWLRSAVLPAVIVELTNVERSGDTLHSLRRSAVLDRAATLKAEHMARESYFAHYSPSGVSPWHWFAEANYNFVHAGENLAIHFSDSGQVVEAWMKSPTHRDNIMSSKYLEIGVGTAEGMYEGYRTVYVVQLFGAPAQAPQVAQVASATASGPGSVVEQVEIPVEVSTTSLAIAPRVASEEVAAESVTLTESVEFFEAEPEPVVRRTEHSELDSVEVTDNEAIATATMSGDTEIVDMDTSDSGVILFSNHISTSTNNIPLVLSTLDTTSGSSVSKILIASTQPQTILNVAYALLALIVVALLVRALLVEMREEHPVQIAYSIILLGLMAGLWSFHMYVTSGAVIV